MFERREDNTVYVNAVPADQAREFLTIFHAKATGFTIGPFGDQPQLEEAINEMFADEVAVGADLRAPDGVDPADYFEVSVFAVTVDEKWMAACLITPKGRGYRPDRSKDSDGQQE